MPSARIVLSRKNTWFQTCLDVMELVLAVELYRHAHGAYPNSLKRPQPLNSCRNFRLTPMKAIRINYHAAQTDYWLALDAQYDDPHG